MSNFYSQQMVENNTMATREAKKTTITRHIHNLTKQKHYTR